MSTQNGCGRASVQLNLVNKIRKHESLKERTEPKKIIKFIALSMAGLCSGLCIKSNIKKRTIIQMYKHKKNCKFC